MKTNFGQVPEQLSTDRFTDCLNEMVKENLPGRSCFISIENLQIFIHGEEDEVNTIKFLIVGFIKGSAFASQFMEKQHIGALNSLNKNIN